MLLDEYTNKTACEAEIRKRLVRALIEEGLLSPEGAACERASDLCAADLPPDELLSQLADEELLTLKPTNKERACAEIADSVVGLQRARQGIVDRWESAKPVSGYSGLIASLREQNTNSDGASALLARCEQLVCDGHPASPAAKTSLGIGEAWREVLPEQTETLRLRFAAVAAEHAITTGLPTLIALRSHLPRLGAELTDEIRKRGLDDFAIIPVHPFQWEHVIRDEFADEIDAGVIHLLETTADAEPLMSVRTLRVSDGIGALHIKVAVEIQLTGAIRGISAGAVAAPLISNEITRILSLDTGFNPRTPEDEPGFSVAEDIAAVRWAADSGVRAHSFGAVLRTDPTVGLKATDVAMPIATLLARNPLTGNTVLTELFAELGGGEETIGGWFEALGRLLFVPAAALLARWGVAVEPHPQNTIIVLREGWPVRVVVRDLGGCRILAQGPLQGTEAIDALHGTALIETDFERLANKVFYPLVANLYRQLHAVATLPKTLRHDIDRRIAKLLADEYWRTHVSGLGLPAGSNDAVFERLLGPVVPFKRVLAMRLSGAVTEQDYVFHPNPLEGRNLLEESYLQERIAPWSEWAAGELRRRVDKAAEEEGLTSGDLARLEDDIKNAQENLALVRAQVDRRTKMSHESYWDLLRTLLPHQATAAADSYGISGHNVHPLAKLRRGFSLEESAVYGPEAGLSVDIRFIALDRELMVSSYVPGNDGFEDLLARHFPGHVRAAHEYLADRNAEGEYVILPVHPWQLRHVIATAFAQEISAGRIIVIPNLVLAALPTISVRTLIPHAPSALGVRPFLKCAMDVTLTSTRRSISQDSALGTPRVAKLVRNAVGQLNHDAGLSPRVHVVRELAGMALTRGVSESKERQRGLSVLLREDTKEYLNEGEIAISASALRGHGGALPSPLADIAEEFFDDYAYDLVATVFGLMFFHGIALEQHLQNTMVRIDLSGEVPVYRGLLLRDFSGLRALSSRLQALHGTDAFEDGAITLTDDYEEFLNKGFYATIFGNLDGIIDEYATARGENPEDLWRRVRMQIDRVKSEARLPIPAKDAEWIERITIRRKSFLSMGLTETGADIYHELQNPLAARLDSRA